MMTLVRLDPGLAVMGWSRRVPLVGMRKLVILSIQLDK